MFTTPSFNFGRPAGVNDDDDEIVKSLFKQAQGVPRMNRPVPPGLFPGPNLNQAGMATQAMGQPDEEERLRAIMGIGPKPERLRMPQQLVPDGAPQIPDAMRQPGQIFGPPSPPPQQTPLIPDGIEHLRMPEEHFRPGGIFGPPAPRPVYDHPLADLGLPDPGTAKGPFGKLARNLLSEGFNLDGPVPGLAKDIPAPQLRDISAHPMFGPEIDRGAGKAPGQEMTSPASDLFIQSVIGGGRETINTYGPDNQRISSREKPMAPEDRLWQTAHMLASAGSMMGREPMPEHFLQAAQLNNFQDRFGLDLFKAAGQNAYQQGQLGLGGRQEDRLSQEAAWNAWLKNKSLEEQYGPRSVMAAVMGGLMQGKDLGSMTPSQQADWVRGMSELVNKMSGVFASNSPGMGATPPGLLPGGFVPGTQPPPGLFASSPGRGGQTSLLPPGSFPPGMKPTDIPGLSPSKPVPVPPPPAPGSPESVGLPKQPGPEALTFLQKMRQKHGDVIAEAVATQNPMDFLRTLEDVKGEKWVSEHRDDLLKLGDTFWSDKVADLVNPNNWLSFGLNTSEPDVPVGERVRGMGWFGKHTREDRVRAAYRDWLKRQGRWDSSMGGIGLGSAYMK